MLTPACDDSHLATHASCTDLQQALVGFTNRLIPGHSVQVDFVRGLLGRGHRPSLVRDGDQFDSEVDRGLRGHPARDALCTEGLVRGQEHGALPARPHAGDALAQA